MSAFSDGMDDGNDAFAVDCGENFTLLARGGQTSTPGTYAAVSIDDLSAEINAIPGGLAAINEVQVFVSQTVMTASGITQDDKLLVRSKRVRISSITDQGDNTLILNCTTAGMSMK